MYPILRRRILSPCTREECLIADGIGPPTQISRTSKEVHPPKNLRKAENLTVEPVERSSKEDDFRLGKKLKPWTSICLREEVKGKIKDSIPGDEYCIKPITSIVSERLPDFSANDRIFLQPWRYIR